MKAKLTFFVTLMVSFTLCVVILGMVGVLMFLSCLRGSEHVADAGLANLKFLSCLRGSERPC